MVRRHFTLLTGWGQPIPTLLLDGSRSAGDDFELNAAQPAVATSDEAGPPSRLVFDAFFSGPGGIHHMFWDSSNQSGERLDAESPRMRRRPRDDRSRRYVRESTFRSSRRSIRRGVWSSSPVTRKS